MPIQPFSHKVNSNEVENYRNLQEESRTSECDQAGHRWTKITYKHSAFWQFKMGLAAIISTLAVIIIGAFFINAIQNLWRNALTGREIIVIKEKSPTEQMTEQIFHQKNPVRECKIFFGKKASSSLEMNSPPDLPIEELQVWNFKERPLSKEQFDALFPPALVPEESKIQELSLEQVYDCLPLFDAERMFLLSDQQVKDFDFRHPNFQNHPLKADLVEKGLLKYDTIFPRDFLIREGLDRRIAINYCSRLKKINEEQINQIISFIPLHKCVIMTVDQFQKLDFEKVSDEQLRALLFNEVNGSEPPVRLNALTQTQVKAKSKFFLDYQKSRMCQHMDPSKAQEYINWVNELIIEDFKKANPDVNLSPEDISSLTG